MSNKEWDDFEDVRSGEAGIAEGGILDSAGLRDYDDVQTAVVKGGVKATLNCRFCNRKRGIELEWPELIWLGENQPGQMPILPQHWQYSPQNATAYVTLPCPSCGRPGFSVHMTPDEARTHVSAGLKSGLVPPQMVNAIQSQFRMQRGR